MNPFFLKIIIRSLTKNKSYALLNIGGLAIGMTVVMLIGLWIHDEFSYNKYHEKYNSIAQVLYYYKDKKDIGDHFTTGMGTVLKEDYGNHFKRIAMVQSGADNQIISFGDRKLSEDGYYMQPDGPHIFTLKMKYGTRDGLLDMNSIMLSESLAKKLFGDINPVNQTVKMDSELDLKVTGVYEDLPLNSEFNDAAFLVPLDRYFGNRSSLSNWNNYSMKIYVQLYPEADIKLISSMIKEAFEPYIITPNYKGMENFLHPMSQWHLFSQFENGKFETSDRLIYVWIYGLIGFFVLLLACINFVNLCTARSEKYIKEIGVRKTLGSRRYQLARVFFSESVLISSIAYIIAVIATGLLLPWFNTVSGKNLIILWENPWFWFFGVIFILLTSFIAGGYPAFYLSSFKAVKAIKGISYTGKQTMSPRKILVVFQFSISIILIISTLIIKKQIQYTKNRPVGYNRERLIILHPNVPEYYKKIPMLCDELKKTGVVQNVAASNASITSNSGSWNDIDWKGKQENLNTSFNTIGITREYGKTIGWKIIEGRDFSQDLKSDISGVIINEAALKQMQLDNPIGESIYYKYSKSKNLTIIGVVEDMIKGSPFEPVDPAIMYLSDRYLHYLTIRIKPSVSVYQALLKIKSVFNEIIPTSPFDYKFADTQYDEKFKEEERTSSLAGSFAVMAILISCLGLYGLAAFLAESRTKEIGIRKANGAKIQEILTMLNTDFTKSVIIAFIIACPIAWYVMNNWLNNFAYKIEVSWRLFILSGIIVLIVALITVSCHSWKAAMRNPVEALRYE